MEAVFTKTGRNPPKVIFGGTPLAFANKSALLDRLEPEAGAGRASKFKTTQSKSFNAIGGFVDEWMQPKDQGWGSRVWGAVPKSIECNLSISCNELQQFMDIGMRQYELAKFPTYEEKASLHDKYEHERLEMFGRILTALISACVEDKFTLDLSKAGFHLMDIRIRKGKDVALVGSFGKGMYAEMTGKLTIVGDVVDVGLILVGGEMDVHGNSFGKTGYFMVFGTIRVFGNIASLGNPDGFGNIYQYERQLVKDGKIVAQPINGD
jgi:hypothetical protein